MADRVDLNSPHKVLHDNVVRALQMGDSSQETVVRLYILVSSLNLSSFFKLLTIKARAMYMYQAAIPEELSFAKGDVLAVLRLQDDGWWEAELAGKSDRRGLVPSNYLQKC